MKNTAILLLAVCLIQQACAETPGKILILDFVACADGRIGNMTYSVDYGIPIVPPVSETDYLLRIYDVNGKVSYSAYFQPGFEIIDTGSQANALRDYAQVRLRIPYYETTRRITITVKGNESYSLDLSPLCDRDGRCDPEENRLSCFQDCGNDSKGGYCDPSKDGVCDTDCMPGWDVDCLSRENWTEASRPVTTITTETTPAMPAPTRGESSIWPYVTVLSLLSLAAALFFIRRRKAKLEIEKKRQDFENWKSEQEKDKKQAAK